MINGTKNVHRRILIVHPISSITIAGSISDSVKLNSLNNKTSAIISKIVKTVTDLEDLVIEILTSIRNTSVLSINSLSGVVLYSRANKYLTIPHSHHLCPDTLIEKKTYDFIILTC